MRQVQTRAVRAEVMTYIKALARLCGDMGNNETRVYAAMECHLTAKWQARRLAKELRRPTVVNRYEVASKDGQLTVNCRVAMQLPAVYDTAAPLRAGKTIAVTLPHRYQTP